MARQEIAEDHFLDSEKITAWAAKMFSRSGISGKHAKIISQALVETSLWGIDSHGIARITHYLGRFENGTLNREPNIQFYKTGAAAGRVDGDDGHGIVIMRYAADKAIKMASKTGCGVAGVYNSSHCGAIGLYTRQITEAGMIGFAFTHADALVVPHGGVRPFFGTNPISIAFPSMNKEEPVCLDMATSIVPWNYMMNAKREKAKVPLGLGVDKDGNDSENAEDIVAVKPMAEHKGYALAFMIDLLCGPLNGMNFGPNMTSMYRDLQKKRKLGSLVMAIDPEKFAGAEYVKKAATEMIGQVKNHGDHVLFPGEPEYINKRNRLKNGIPVSDAIAQDLRLWSKKLGVRSLV